jgi:hypothetical protein
MKPIVALRPLSMLVLAVLFCGPAFAAPPKAGGDDCEVCTGDTVTGATASGEFQAAGGGKSSPAHAQAKAAKEAADQAEEIRATKRAEARVRKAQAGEASARSATPVPAPVAATASQAAKGGKSSRAHAQARAAKEAADWAAASEE